MEPGLSGLQSETSSCIALCLIVRAHEPKGWADDALKRLYAHDYVYFVSLVELVSSKTIAKHPILSCQFCLSDSLLGEKIKQETVQPSMTREKANIQQSLRSHTNF